MSATAISSAREDLWQRTLQDLALRLKNARELVSKGDPRGQYLLALMLLHGRGTGEDSVTALELLNKAADQGHAGAIYELTRLYSKGDATLRIDRNLPKAKIYAHKIDNFSENNKFDEENYNQKDYIEQIKSLQKVVDVLMRMDFEK